MDAPRGDSDQHFRADRRQWHRSYRPDAFLLTPLEPGDANGDGRVDINDLTIVLANFGQTGMAWSQGDFTGDGTVDMNNLTIVLANYGYGVTAPSPPPSPSPPPCAPPRRVGLCCSRSRLPGLSLYTNQ